MYSYSDDIAFAQYVLAKYGGRVGALHSLDQRFEMECKKLEGECAAKNGRNYSVRIYLLTIAGNRIKPLTDQDADLKITCYRYAGASCRQQVIYYLPDLLATAQFEWTNDPVWYREYLTSELAKAYQGERMYQKAATLYEKLYYQHPEKSHYAVGLINMLNCMGSFDTSLQLLENIKQSEMYKMSGKQYRALIEHQGKMHQKGHEKKWGIKRGIKFKIKNFLFGIKHRIEPINRYKEEIDMAELSTGEAIVSARNKSDYEWLAINLPDMCPKSFSGYMRMKNQNTKNFMKIAKCSIERGRDITIADIYTEQAKKLADIKKLKTVNV
ncbi:MULTISPECIES: hypothetical protein [environmental samples]|uniref:hypothetical protein n=1 Tax=environmental samples TaxID=876090 RepID=UPI000336B12E|nr:MULTISPECIES: hypothetical protein [environmental samples]CDC68372.1 putative uncharacterized protein [Oscillibacter sp. CAG:155]